MAIVVHPDLSKPVFNTTCVSKDKSAKWHCGRHTSIKNVVNHDNMNFWLVVSEKNI